MTILKSLLFPNPLYDHEEQLAACVDRTFTFLAPEEQLQVSCKEGDQVEEVGDCVDRGVGGLVPLEVLHDEAVDCLHGQVELEHEQAEEVGDCVDRVVTVSVTLKALHNNSRTVDEVDPQT